MSKRSIFQVYVTFVARHDTNDWFIWHTQSEGDWENNNPIPEIPNDLKSKGIWIDLPEKEVLDILEDRRVTASVWSE